MDMVTRVAQSLARCAWERFKASDSSWAMAKYPGGADQYCAEQWELYANDARSAIEAMREPTEEMIRDGHLLDPLGCDVDDEDAAMIYTRIWGAMLSAALSPSGEK